MHTIPGFECFFCFGQAFSIILSLFSFSLFGNNVENAMLWPGGKRFLTHLEPFLKLVHLLCPMNECGKFWSSSFLQTFFSLFFFMCEKPTSSMNICGLSEAQHKENQCKGF